jgi:hypothetical protein
MEDPAIRPGSPGRVLRACQRNRLERELMGNAYEYLVPILKCRCERPGGTFSRPTVLGLGEGQVPRVCSAGGGL